MLPGHRQNSVEPDALVKHQHSFSSDSNRLSIPMWDSSDPERSPPALPLNPGNRLVSRLNASAVVANAAKMFGERAREHAPTYTTNPISTGSPSQERSLVKGAAHRRLKSLSDESWRQFNRGARTPTHSPEKMMERPLSRDGSFSSSTSSAVPEPSTSPATDRAKAPASTLTPAQRELMRDTPPSRAPSRSPYKPIVGDSTTPSATYMALQSIPHDDSDTTTPRAKQKIRQNLSAQINDIAAIASSLQREMAQLSRRSKDNATDLISLKEATNARDEDIRKSLKDLVSNINSSALFAPPPPIPSLHGRSNSFGGTTAAPATPDTTDKSTFRLPRMSSSPFVDDRIGSPSPYSIEGAASVAMLEKIVREMVTKEGQERLINTLNGLFEKSNQESGETSKKVGELVESIKQGPESRALTVLDASRPDGQVARATRDINAAVDIANEPNISKPYSSPKAADFVSADMLKLLRKIKDTVEASGCTSSETKVLVGDLKDELLAVGHQLGRKIDYLRSTSADTIVSEDGKESVDLSRIVQEGLADLKEHMDHVLASTSRAYAAATAVPPADSDHKVHAVVKHALAQPDPAACQVLGKETIFDAVREAYETYKPEIELQQFGLERDEILSCLREGLAQYRTSAPTPAHIGRDDVMDAVMEALTHVEFPQPPSNAHEVRDEVLSAVRECLDEIRPLMQLAAGPSQPDPEILHDIILAAVRDGFERHGEPAARELEISRDDLFDAVRVGLEDAPRELEISREDLFEAVKAGLQSAQTPLGGYGEQVLSRLEALVTDMRAEFKAYSSANGRDTEQVLDAFNDGLESLRAKVEGYVDRARDMTSKDQIIDSLRHGLESLRSDVQGYVAAGPQGDQAINRAEMLQYIHSEFEHLHDALTQQIAPATSEDKAAFMRALNDGFDGLRTYMQKRDDDDFVKEEVEEAMKAEFNQLREAIVHEGASHRDEILDTIHASLETLHTKLEEADKQNRSAHSSEEATTIMNQEFAHLREVLTTALIKSDAAVDSKDGILNSIHESMDTLRIQLTTSQDESSQGTLASIRDEIGRLNENFGSSLIKAGDAEQNKHDDILAALHTGLESVKDVYLRNTTHNHDDKALRALCEHVETLRQGLVNNVASRADTEEILDTVRLGLDDLRADLSKKLDSPERLASATGEILDVINDGVESLRADIKAVTGAVAPVDMSVNYEILDTLKQGIHTISTEINLLKADQQATAEAAGSSVGNEVVLVDEPDKDPSRGAPPANDVEVALRRGDLRELEGLMMQLQVKVDAMDASIQNIPVPEPPDQAAAPGVAMKDDLTGVVQKDDLADLALKEDLVNVEELLKDVQAAVTVLSEDKRRDTDMLDGLARKEDTDAIETLLQNAKAKLDEIILPDPETTIKKENLDSIEAAVLVTNESIDKLTAKIGGDDVASKGDIAVVEVLVQDLKTALDALKETIPSKEDDAKKATREDFDELAILAIEIKEKLAGLPHPEAVPSKADIQQVVGLIHDFRDSHDKMKESYEGDIGITAKAFDDRKNEAESIISSIGKVKETLAAFKDEIREGLREGDNGVECVKSALEALGQTITTDLNVTSDVKELMETVNREFERAHGSIEGLKVDYEEKATASLEKQDQLSGVILNGLGAKLDERFADMTNRYDDMLVLAEASAQRLDEKTAAQAELMTNIKTLSEELKTTVAGLGITLTHSTAKLDAEHGQNRIEHQLTRDEVAKTVVALSAMQADLTENHPRMMMTLNEVLAVVTQIIELAKASEETAKAAHEEFRAATALAATEAQNRSEELRESFFAGLPALLPPPPEPANKQHDSEIEEKLTQLLSYAADAENPAANVIVLDEIRRQVMATASEVTELVQNQAKLITTNRESMQRDVEDSAITLERRLAQRDQIESQITDLNNEKDTLRQEVETLRHEKEVLTSQNASLFANASAFETALSIRREELREMEHRADALERRILDGIMDHSRALLLQRQSKHPKALPVHGNASPIVSAVSPVSTVAKGVRMAFGTRPTIKRSTATDTDPKTRRILSLSQINGNTPMHGAAFASAPNTGLKRSHSVRTSDGYHKPSWSSRRVFSDANKENDVLDEESEGETSDAGTERHHSIINGAGTAEDFSSAYEGDGRASNHASEYTYATGSYLTGTMDNAPTTIHNDDTLDENYDNDNDYDDDDDDPSQYNHILKDDGTERVRPSTTELERASRTSTELEKEDIAAPALRSQATRVIIGPDTPRDGALGSDIPTIRLDGMLSPDYFRRAAEEEASQVSSAVQ